MLYVTFWKIIIGLTLLPLALDVCFRIKNYIRNKPWEAVHPFEVFFARLTSPKTLHDYTNAGSRRNSDYHMRYIVSIYFGCLFGWSVLFGGLLNLWVFQLGESSLIPHFLVLTPYFGCIIASVVVQLRYINLVQQSKSGKADAWNREEFLTPLFADSWDTQPKQKKQPRKAKKVTVTESDSILDQIK